MRSRPSGKHRDKRQAKAGAEHVDSRTVSDLPPDPFAAPLPEDDFERWANGDPEMVERMRDVAREHEHGVETMKALIGMPDFGSLTVAVQALDEAEVRIALIVTVTVLRPAQR